MDPHQPGSCLLDHQRIAVLDLFDDLAAAGYSRRELQRPETLSRLRAVMTTADEVHAVLLECEELVRWDRPRGYALAYLAQQVTAKGSNLHPWAALTFSDAQIGCGEDFAFHSAEVAWRGLHSMAPYLDESLRDKVLDGGEQRLRMQHRFYSSHLRTFDYLDVNPLVDHLYDRRVMADLRTAYWNALEHLPGMAPADAAELLLRAANEASAKEDAYHWLAARRLAAVHAGMAEDLSAAESLYRDTLRDARELGLEAEIGHLLRQHGWVLKRLGFPAAAARQQRLALTHEQPVHLLAYWAALSARELGDALGDVVTDLVRVGQAHAADEDLPARLARAVQVEKSLKECCEAYGVGRRLLDVVCAGACLPATVAVTRQLVRSFSDNAIGSALWIGRNQDVLAEIEALGPRDLATTRAELAAAATIDGDGDVDVDSFLAGREVYHRHLTSVPDKFEEYVARLPEEYDSRHRYLVARDQFAVAPQTSDEVVARLWSLVGAVDLVVLAFQIGPRPSSQAVVVDLATGALEHRNLGAVELPLREAYNAFAAALNAVAPLRGTPALTAETCVVIDEFVARIDAMLAPALDLVACTAAGRPLVVVPQLQLHAVPWAALQCGDSLLRDIVADLATAPSLEVLLNGGGEEVVPQAEEPLLVLRASSRTPFFDGTVEFVRRRRPITVISDPSPSAALEALEAGSGDVFFACHGVFDVDVPTRSRLILPAEPGLSLADVSRGMGLTRRRSITMGACDSGRVRSTLQSEYLGLTATLTASGAGTVIASLWQVNMLASAILLADVLADCRSIPAPTALAAAQRRLAGMSRNQVVAWVGEYVPALRPLVESMLDRSDAPFAHPYYWAGFAVGGRQFRPHAVEREEAQ